MKNLTEIEIAALRQYHNLADGHTTRQLSGAEQRVVESAPALWEGSQRERHRELERRYLENFFRLGGQTLEVPGGEYFLCYTASTAIEVVANLLRLTSRTAALVEPCFDNLSDILRRHRVRAQALPDSLYADPERLSAALDSSETEAVFVVSPNNPTGAFLSPAALRAITTYCRRRDAILILDACFRFYLPESKRYDQYAILAEAGIDWIVIEDTGKTWPTVEIKAPFFGVSQGLSAEVSKIYSDFVLHISPFAVQLLDGFVQASIADGLASVTSPVAANRATLAREIAGSGLTDVATDAVSVAWVRLPGPSTRLISALRDDGVHVLPGEQFFWSSSMPGTRYMRVALARDPARFAESAARLGRVASRFVPDRQVGVGVTS